MLSLFVNVVLPVFIVAGLGYLIEKRLRLPIAPFNQLVLYVLMPALVFTSLLAIDFRTEEPVKIALFTVPPRGRDARGGRRDRPRRAPRSRDEQRASC